MKKIVFVTCFLTTCTAFAQDQAGFSLNKSNKTITGYGSTLFQLADSSTSKTIGMSSIADELSLSGKQIPRGLALSSELDSKLNLSPYSKVQYGLRLTATAIDINKESTAWQEAIESKNMRRFSAGGFLSYKLNSKVSLDTSLTTSLSSANPSSNQFDNGLRATQFSVTAKATSLLTVKHRITNSFSVNWKNTSSYATVFGNAFVDSGNRSLLGLNDRPYSRTELRFSTNWNWNLDTNWTLSTGITASHSLNDPTKYPFYSKRTPITIFSVASYRF